MRFSICIPNYNSELYIEKLIGSIKNQTYKDYEVIIVDDMSTDDSPEMIKELKEPDWYFGINEHKRYNGGTRNVAVDLAGGDYIVFMDCDDYFYRPDALEKISDEIDRTRADLIRLPYHYLVAKGEGNVMLAEPNIEELTRSVFVAPWTKCIKRELYVQFPENTLIEDVSQHIEQMDKIKTMGHCSIPVMVWNCRNKDAISQKEGKNPKRDHSYLRILADLLDIEVTKPYCIEHKKWRIRNYIQVTKEKLEEIERRYQE